MAEDERNDAQQPEEPDAGEQPAPEETEEVARQQQGEEPAEEPSSESEEASSEEAPGEEAPGEDAASEEAPGEETPSEEGPTAEAPSEDAPSEEAPSEEAPSGEAPGEEAPSEEAGERPAEEGEAPRERPRRRGRGSEDAPQEEVIPGAHLEPDLVLEEEQLGADDQYAEAGVAYAEEEEGVAEAVEAEEAEPQPVAREPLDLAADARYQATGKRKSAVARVILKPGEGVYTINGRHLDQFFPRVKLQRMAQQPLETAGYHNRMDVVAKIHGGGVSSQAGALRHGIARALVEADPNLRAELKRRGFLTRDPRVKERKKAGLKKARKRPQFSKR
jgi:small subunit ribosomal protein S9